jgi:hypothetical protein
MRLILSLTLVLLASCNEDNATMKPGEDCLSCHRPGGEASFTVAGTVFPVATSATNQGLSGASILITDANNKSLTLTSNSAGNFHTSSAFTFPVSVAITHAGNTVTMGSAPNGACNSCHTNPPQGSAPGRVSVP